MEPLRTIADQVVIISEFTKAAYDWNTELYELVLKDALEIFMTDKNFKKARLY